MPKKKQLESELVDTYSKLRSLASSFTVFFCFSIITSLATYAIFEISTKNAGSEQNFQVVIADDESVENWKEVLYDKVVVSQVDDIITSPDSVRDYMREGNQNNLLVRNMIFHGPPGTGKSYSASVIAKSFGSHYRIVAAGGLQHKYVGTGAAAWSKIVCEAKRLAKKNAESKVEKPVFIIVEEMDSLCANHDERRDDTLLNNFLESIDSIQRENANIIVIGTTNYLEILAPSAKRAGRFTRVYFRDRSDNDMSSRKVEAIKKEITKAFVTYESVEEAEQSGRLNTLVITDKFWEMLRNKDVRESWTFVEIKEQVIIRIKKAITAKRSDGHDRHVKIDEIDAREISNVIVTKKEVQTPPRKIWK